MSAAIVGVAQQPKAAHAPSECEDAIGWCGGGVAGDPLVLAVADGATESYAARPWSQTLVRSCLSSGGAVDLGDVVDRARSAWSQPTVVDGGVGPGPPSWLADAARARGSWSTLLRVVIGAGEVQAVAVGDSCVFVGRDDRLSSFPIDSADAFGAAPPLVAAEPDLQPRGVVTASTWSVAVRQGDVVLVATDALSEWVLREDAQGRRPLAVLRHAVESSDAFATWVAAARVDGALRDDDTTCAVAEVR